MYIECAARMNDDIIITTTTAATYGCFNTNAKSLFVCVSIIYMSLDNCRKKNTKRKTQQQ